jgi:hypothetical protein
MDPRHAALRAVDEDRQARHEGAWKVLPQLPYDPDDEVVVVEKPFGWLSQGALRVALCEARPGLLDRSRERARVEERN